MWAEANCLGGTAPERGLGWFASRVGQVSESSGVVNGVSKVMEAWTRCPPEPTGHVGGGPSRGAAVPTSTSAPEGAAPLAHALNSYHSVARFMSLVLFKLLSLLELRASVCE